MQKAAMQKAMAYGQIALFVVMVALNYLATSEDAGAVAFTNSQIADTHPVYGLPQGWAFAIWGIIFMTLGLYTVYQALPASCYGGFDDEIVQKIRLPVIGLEVFNSAWNFLFGWEAYWMALLDIVLYDILLWVVIRRARVNYFAPLPNMSPWKALRTKLFVAMPFSVHAAWVTVASVLNIQVNLLEEGWMPSPSFSIGCCWLAVTIGVCLTIFPHADLPYALVTLWALGGIITNQQPDSTFGCVSRICGACNEVSLPICAHTNTAAADRLPNGWAHLNCASMGKDNVTGWGTAETVARDGLACMAVIVPKSEAVLWWSVAGLFTVIAVFGAGVANALMGGYMPVPSAAGKAMGDDKASQHEKLEDGVAMATTTPTTMAAVM